MIKGYYSMIAAWLSEYYKLQDGSPIPPDVVYIKTILKLMILYKGWTKDDLRRDALRKHNLIIREDLFPDETGKDEGDDGCYD